MPVLCGTLTQIKLSNHLSKSRHLRAGWQLTNGMLDTKNIPSLEERRIHLKLGLLYKIIHNLCYFPDDIFEFRPTPRYVSRNVNPMALKQPFARTNAFYYSFVPYTTSLWNSLSYSQVTAPSLSSFKRLI